MITSETVKEPVLDVSPPPSPAERPSADVVIYDGNCVFCRGQVANLRRLDTGGRLAYLSLHDPAAQKLAPGRTHDDLMREMVVVDRSGKQHGGASAIRYLARRLPWLWPIAPVLHLPGTMPMWSWLYRQVAKRRYKISGGPTCDNGSCRI